MEERYSFERKTHNGNTAYTILFGLSCGLIFFIGESIVNWYYHNFLNSTYYILAPFIYALIGIITSIFSIALLKIIKLINAKNINLFTLFKEKQGNLAIIPAVILFIQGLVVMNALILPGFDFFSFSSILFDFLWLFLSFLLFLSVLYFSSMHYLKTKLSLSLFFSVIGIAIFYRALPRADEVVYILALTKIFMIFLICYSIFFIIFFLPRVLQKEPRVQRFIIVFICMVIGIMMFALPYYLYKNSKIIPSRTSSSSSSKDVSNKPNIILIVIDTLRADHLSCYGYPLKTSPNIDRFSLEGMKFSKCYSPSNWTPPGHASIFTGKFPISHGLHRTISHDAKVYKHTTCFLLTDEEVTLAEILHNNGYDTAAIVSNFAFVSKLYGLDQGFEYWFAMPPHLSEPILFMIFNKFNILPNHIIASFPFYRRADDINNVVINWINKYSKKPFFLFINYMEPHSPYVPPPPYDLLFTGKISNYYFDLETFRMSQKNLSKRELNHLQSQYDGEIAYVDAQLGILFEKLKSYDLYDQSIIVVTGDHGEFLGEHGLVEHQIGLYDPVIKTPLIFKPHKSFAWNGIIDIPVQTIDILPTILQMLGIKIPEFVQGNSLLSTMNHPIIAEHYSDASMLEWYGGRFRDNQRAIIRDSFKFILSEQGEKELYNIHDDELENFNLMFDKSEQASFLNNELQEWKNNVPIKLLNADDIPQLDESTKEKLKSLGYIH